MSAKKKAKSLLTKALIKKVVAKVALGNFRATAFALNGVPPKTWPNWIEVANKINDGKKKSVSPHTELCLELAEALNKAEAVVQDRVVQDILAPSTPTKLKLQYMERRHGKLFMKNPYAVHADDDAGKEGLPDAKEILKELLFNLATRNG